MENLQNNPCDCAFVIGNGTSRAGICLPDLMQLGTVYGCNAQYREYAPHHLVAVDVKMIKEIVKTGYHLDHAVWTNPNRGVKQIPGLNLISPHRGWASGPTALWLAARNGHKKIFILGFDYYGIGGKVNNMYAGTANYKKPSDKATYHGNWLNQTKRVLREYNTTQFCRVIASDCQIPDLLNSINNLTHISLETFNEQLIDIKKGQKSTV